MKTLRVTVLIFLVLVGLCHAAADDDPLFPLADGWGKGTIIDFRKAVYKNVPVLANREGGAAVEKWCLDLLGYPDLLEETGTRYWMQAKVSTLEFCIRMRFIDTSTNCWLAAAGLLNRYHMIAREAESNASVKVDYSLTKTNPKRYNELLYGRKPLEVRARNLKYVEDSLAYVVTNEFPEGILPSLPESERDKMMSEVFVRAGLASADDKNERPLTKQHLKCVILFAVASSLVLAGCVVLRRFV